MKITVEITDKGGRKITAEGNSSKEIINELNELKKYLSESYSETVSELESNDSEITLKVSVAEMLRKSKTKTISDRILIMFYHLLKNEGYLKANVKDIRELFREIREPLPENISALLNNMETNGYIKKAEKKDKFKAWSLTKTGHDTAEKMLTESED